MSHENKIRNTVEITPVSKTTNSFNEKHDDVSREILIGAEITVAPNKVKKVTKKSTFELPIELHKRLKKAAAEREMTMLEIVEEALESHLES